MLVPASTCPRLFKVSRQRAQRPAWPVVCLSGGGGGGLTFFFVDPITDDLGQLRGPPRAPGPRPEPGTHRRLATGLTPSRIGHSLV